MTPNRHDVAAARSQAEAAKARLFGTLADVQQRMKPSNLAQDAVESAAHGVASVVRKGAEAARSRPFATAGVAAAIGLVMARGWIGDIIGGRHETPDAATGLKDKSAARATKG